VTRHLGHILQVTLAPFFTDRAIVRVVDHQAFDNTLTHIPGLFVIYGDNGAVAGRRHASHHQSALLVIRITILFDGALAASSY
jgi:hypothetical protein